MEREYKNVSDNSQHDDTPEPALPTPQKQATDLSDLLADIDTVLEENAQDFVKSFIQKGGQ